MSTQRLFIGLVPDDGVRTALANFRDAYTWPRSAALVATPKLHLTLHFLGDVAVEAIAPLRAALALPFSPFELRLGLPVSWHGGIAVLEPFETPPALLALHQQLAEVLDALGLPRDARAYKPHVTMARRAVGAVPPPQPPDLDWSVRDFSLMASRGGVYDTVQHYPASG